MIVPYLASSLVNLLKPENKCHFGLVKDLNSTKMNDSLLNPGIPVTLYSNMLTYRDSKKSFKLDGNLLDKLKNYVFNVSHSNPQDQKLIFQFGKEMIFNIKTKGRKSPSDQPLKNLIKSPAIMASGISTVFLPSDPDELCDRWKLILQEKHAGNNSNIINDEIVAIADKLLD